MYLNSLVLTKLNLISQEARNQAKKIGSSELMTEISCNPHLTKTQTTHLLDQLTKNAANSKLTLLVFVGLCEA